MLTADYLMNVAEPLVDLWAQVEDDIIADIARHIIKNGGQMTATAKWQTLKLREMGVLQTDVAKALAKATKQSEKQTYAMIVEACQKALAFDDAFYLKAGYYPLPLNQSAALQELILAGCRKTDGLMRNFTGTTAHTATMAFENALDRAYLQVNSGAFSYTEALRRCIRDLSEQGIQKIAYPSGHADRMDVAARRALLTGLNQTTAELQLARMDELGTDLIEVSSHAGARPSHAEWQGQVYSKSGRGAYDNFYEATGYGTGDGLCGWNCYHSFFPYFEGLSQPTFERDPARRLGKTNNQMYEESQRQRYLERKVRDARRACSAYSAARDSAKDQAVHAALDEDFHRAAALLKRREEALAAFCEETDRTNLLDRLYVPTYNKSVSGKVVWSVRRDKILEKAQQKSGIKGAFSWKSKYHGLAESKISMDEAHIMGRGHDVTREQALSYIKNARVTITRNQGGKRWQLYFSDEGAAYLDLDNVQVKTAFTAQQYDEKTKIMMEEIRNGTMPTRKQGN